MKKKRFRAAAAQTLARLGDIEHNIALSTQPVDEAVRQGAVCRQKQMIPKVDMFANRLTQTYSALVEASPRAEAAE